MRKGRPVLGAFSGFFFGLFLSLTLLVFGVLPLDSILVAILPGIFLVVGGMWGKIAPLGAKAPKEPAPPAPPATTQF